MGDFERWGEGATLDFEPEPSPDLRSRAIGLMSRANTIHGDAKTARRHIASITNGRCSFDVANARRFAAYGAVERRLGDSNIQILQWNTETECRTSTERVEDQHLVFHLVLDGAFEVMQAGQRACVSKGQLLIVSHPGTVVRHWHGRCDLLNLVVPRTSLSKCLTREFGVAEDAGFEPLAVVDLTSVPTIVGLLETIVADLSGKESVFSSFPLSGQAELMLLLLLLKTLPHRQQAVLDKSPARIAPYYIRRVEKHVLDNMQDDVTVEQLADVAGVSLRTLYYGFNEFRNVSPMRYLKQARLARAREILLSAVGRPPKIGVVAADVGYTSVSQFCRDYKTRFSETPMATLSRSVR